MLTTDFLVIGGGIIGLNIARELKRKFHDQRVLLVEKEPRLGLHASGRNSGVLHAGFYYTADSLKARFTRQGNLALTEYCEAKGIPVNKCGKLVVAKNAEEYPVLDELLKRACANGVPLEKITLEEARQIEPRVKSHLHALWSPSTASVDPAQVMDAMSRDAEAEGVRILTGAGYLGRANGNVVIRGDSVAAGYVVNAAGLHADKIARDFGFAEQYRILPFKGVYLYSSEPRGALHTNIYPVPDLRNPFLGVHFTVTVDGHIKIGPTAIPAFWREQYEGLHGFSLAELAEILYRQAGLFLWAGFDFRRLAFEEIRKYARAHLVALSTHLLEGVELEHYQEWGRAGIRAQLLDITQKKLVMDFIFEHDDKSLHVLNAVSPGFTCAIPFSRYIVGQICQA